MTRQFRLPHRADSMWEAIGGNNGTLFQQMTEENNRAVEDQIVQATNNQGDYFIAVFDTGSAIDPDPTSTTNCEAEGSVGGVAGVSADTLGVYIIFANHSVSTGDSYVTISGDTFPDAFATNGTASSVGLSGSEYPIGLLPDSSAPGAWTGELSVWGFKVGEITDLL